MSTTWASLLLKLTSFQSPLLRAVVPCAAAAFAIQGLAGAPSVLFQTERFFDISGSLTFISVGALSLYLPALRAKALALVNGAVVVPSLPTLRQLLTDSASAAVAARNWRQVALTALVLIWATRLGSYLFSRVMADGSDSRFDEIRGNPGRFSRVFMIQAVWVMIPLLPVIAINAVPAATLATALPRVAWHDVLGFGAWVVGFYFEAVADYQKSQWAKQKKLKQHDEEFLTSGLFSKCRYPHYFGEITMWTGISTVAASILCRKPIQLALGLSGGPAGILGTTTLSYVGPYFITLLLTKVSGIPMSEPKYDKKFGDRKDYQEWRQNTPRLIPKLF